MKFDLKLKSIEFKNFRLFERFEMEFHPNLTVLIGENGSGKTALVEGVAKMITPITKLIQIPYFSDREYFTLQKEIFSKNDKKYSRLAWESKVQLECLFNNKINTIKWEGKSDRSIFNSEFDQKGLDTLRKISWEFNEVRNNNNDTCISIVVYYPCEKVDNISINGEEIEFSEHDIFDAYNNALNARSFDFRQFFEWYKWQEDREARGQSSPALNVARKAILAMLNDEGEEEQFKRIFIDVKRFKNYQLMLQKGDVELEVSQLSGGEKSLFALVSDIARRLAIANPISNDPLAEGTGIVLIDEIDLHLHPRWQRKIVKKLCEIFPKIQFIITTHSPLIISSIKSENIRLLENGKVYSIPETLGQNVGVIIKQIMGVEESIYDKELKQIFRLLTKNNLEEAKKEIEKIERETPADIPDLREAKAILKRKEILSE